MLIWSNSQVVDTASGESLQGVEVNNFKEIVTNPIIWGFADYTIGELIGAIMAKERESVITNILHETLSLSHPYSRDYGKKDVHFIQQIASISEQSYAPNCAPCLWLRNGVVEVAKRRITTLYDALKDEDLSGGIIYIPLRSDTSRFVRIEFSRDISVIMTKLRMLIR